MNNMDNNYMVYVGTYTFGKSQGIYIFNLDIKSGELTPAGVSEKVPNPSYLTFDKNKRYLYSVLETDKFEEENGGAVAAFSVDSKTGCLQLINCQPAKGKSPCHLSTDSNNRYLFAGNYSEGTLTVFPINSDGSIGAHSAIIAHEGSGPDVRRQEKSHVHYAMLTPEEKHLCVVDLGIDKVVIYNFNPLNGSLTAAEDLTISVKPGSGPRHLEFNPEGSYAYLINELSSDITVFRYSQGMKWEEVQSISTLPDGCSIPSFCAAIHITPDGKYLYASNRGHDSIAAFSIDSATGKLELISHTSTLGKFPRDFAIDPTGRFLFAANQNSDSIVSFKIEESGSLVPISGILEVPNPVCIKIVKF